MSAEEAIVLVTAMCSLIAKHVPDEKAKQAIALDLKRLLDSPGVPHAARRVVAAESPVISIVAGEVIDGQAKQSTEN